MSFGRLEPTLQLKIPTWLRIGFLAVLVTHDLAVIFAGGWGLVYQPFSISKALGDTVLDDVWGWLFVVGGLLALWGATRIRPAVETVGCLFTFSGYLTLGVATLTASLFGDYSVAGGVAIIAGGIGSLRRIGRVWAGVYLRETGGTLTAKWRSLIRPRRAGEE